MQQSIETVDLRRMKDFLSDLYIPTGNTAEDYRIRVHVIRRFYHFWKLDHPEQRVFNPSLNDYINIRFVSIDETSSKAARSYLSTLAVLQLDVVLVAAIKTGVSKPKPNVSNQRGFRSIILMECDLISIGKVKLTVGVQNRSNEKIQYCITSIQVEK